MELWKVDSYIFFFFLKNIKENGMTVRHDYELALTGLLGWLKTEVTFKKKIHISFCSEN